MLGFKDEGVGRHKTHETNSGGNLAPVKMANIMQFPKDEVDKVMQDLFPLLCVYLALHSLGWRVRGYRFYGVAGSAARPQIMENGKVTTVPAFLPPSPNVKTHNLQTFNSPMPVGYNILGLLNLTGWGELTSGEGVSG